MKPEQHSTADAAMRVYGYARVSVARTDERKQEKELGDSLQVQQQKIEARATQDGWTVTEFFVDAGISGATALDERPQGKRLLATVQSGDVVIATKLDRMFRSANDALRVLEGFKERRISLILMDLGGDVTGNGVSQLVFTLLAAVAQFERERIAERIRDSKLDAKARGKYLGGRVPFGMRMVHPSSTSARRGRHEAPENISGEVSEYGPVPTGSSVEASSLNAAEVAASILQRDPKQQKAIAMMRKLRAQGLSYQKIAARVTKRTGIKVNGVLVQRVLKGGR